MVRHLRMQSYNDIFAGDPTWVTESIGGRFNDGRTKVTKTSFRFLQTLYNLGPSPEPNLTILWSPDLPQGFKDFCAKVSADTSSIQYENDDLMREVRGSDDYGIACCVSYQDIGRQMQFFGARCNLAKALLLAINGGRCENTGTLMVKGIPALTEGPLRFEEVMRNYKMVLTEIARVYNEAMNIIHYMHDKYYYEKAQMAFVDTDPRINLAYGVAGLSIALDSLSAIKYAKVTARRNEQGLTDGFDIEGEFPCFGNNDDRVDHLGVDLVYFFSEELKKLPVYKNARPTLSLLTITSNVMYGKKTGATPDGRAKGRGLRTGCQPDARTRQERRHRFALVGGQTALPRLAGRYLEHLLDRPEIAGPDRRGADREPGDDARRLLYEGRTPPERQRAEPRDARRCHGASREVSAVDDPRLGLRRELHQTEPRASVGGHQPQLPREDVNFQPTLPRHTTPDFRRRRIRPSQGRGVRSGVGFINCGLQAADYADQPRAGRQYSDYASNTFLRIDGNIRRAGTPARRFPPRLQFPLSLLRQPRHDRRLRGKAHACGRDPAHGHRPETVLRTARRGDLLGRREPTFQAAALVPLVRQLHGAGIHVCLDSNGGVWNPAVEELLGLVDLVLLDVKQADPERHRTLTGRDNAQTLRTAAWLEEHGKAVLAALRTGARVTATPRPTSARWANGWAATNR